MLLVMRVLSIVPLDITVGVCTGLAHYGQTHINDQRVPNWSTNDLSDLYIWDGNSFTIRLNLGRHHYRKNDGKVRKYIDDIGYLVRGTDA